MAGLERPNPVILDVERVRQTRESSIDRAAGETCEVWQERPDFGIGGFVVRNSFSEMAVSERQRWLSGLFREVFGPAADVERAFWFACREAHRIDHRDTEEAPRAQRKPLSTTRPSSVKATGWSNGERKAFPEPKTSTAKACRPSLKPVKQDLPKNFRRRGTPKSDLSIIEMEVPRGADKTTRPTKRETRINEHVDEP